MGGKDTDVDAIKGICNDDDEGWNLGVSTTEGEECI